jgi:hypothetical protein
VAISFLHAFTRSLSTIPIFQTVMPRHKKDLHAGQALLRHLTSAFTEGGLENLDAELKSLCVALSRSTPEHAAVIDGWLAERARESLEASIAARASFA